MSPRLQIMSILQQRVEAMEEPSLAALFGIVYNQNLLVIGLSFDLKLTKQIDPLLETLEHLPTGVDLCGIAVCYKHNAPLLSDHEMVQLLKEVFVTDNPVCIKKLVGGTPTYHMLINDKLSEIEACNIHFVGPEIIQENFSLVQIKANFKLQCSRSAKAVVDEIEYLRKKVASGKPLFSFCESKIFFGSKRRDSFKVGFDHLNPDYDEKEIMGAIQALVCTFSNDDSSNSSDEEKVSAFSPQICVKEEAGQTLMKALTVDGLVLVPKTRLLSDSYGSMVDCVCRSLNLFKLYILKNLNTNEKLNCLRVKHFLPQWIGHHVSFIYPTDQSDRDLQEEREYFHELFGIPLTNPVFRSLNALNFNLSAEKYASLPLCNVHRHAKPSGVPQGIQKVVQGTYRFYHYMQQGFNDSGWGCAYRSLQTLFSWFRLHGYTNKEVPTHKEIQRCLVDIGDKKEEFIGSKEWIGSMEVAYVLDTMLQVSCRILDLQNISCIKDYASEVMWHFQINGTPIMIGGSNYAHTILGIDYNELTQDLKLLILDPHYVGPDEIGPILLGKGVGWRGLEFFSKTSFYNLCMPQKPNFF